MFFFLDIRRPPQPTLFPSRRSSDLLNINMTLNALEASRDAKLLADPRISVVDGEDASIFIGDLLRYRVLQSVTTGGSEDRKSTRLNSSHVEISYAVFCLKKKKKTQC